VEFPQDGKLQVFAAEGRGTAAKAVAAAIAEAGRELEWFEEGN
jgi:hypothetical protein